MMTMHTCGINCHDSYLTLVYAQQLHFYLLNKSVCRPLNLVLHLLFPLLCPMSKCVCSNLDWVNLIRCNGTQWNQCSNLDWANLTGVMAPSRISSGFFCLITSYISYFVSFHNLCRTFIISCFMLQYFDLMDCRLLHLL